MVEGHVGGAGVLHRRGGRAAVAVRIGVAGGVPIHKSRGAPSAWPGLLLALQSGSRRTSAPQQCRRSSVFRVCHSPVGVVASVVRHRNAEASRR